MRWSMSWNELEALKELAGGVCVEPGDAIWERLIDKGLAAPDEGMVRASVAGEVVIEAIAGQELQSGLTTVVSLVEEPLEAHRGHQKSIEDFF